MKALIDRHHHALFYSLQLLFEDRLGTPVYTPIGHEWWDAGIWRFGEVYGDDRLAQQFLTMDRPGEWTRNPESGVYEGRDNHHPDRIIRGITLDTARKVPQDWAYVVATVQDNQAGFHRFAQELSDIAPLSRSGPVKYVLHAGNTNQFVDWSLDPLAIVTGEVPILGRGVRVHQEIDRQAFRYREPVKSKTIRSFVNCFGSTPCVQPFEEVRTRLPEWYFRSHGIDGPNGNVETVAEIARLMASSAFGWHDKHQGDGFGHVIHDWAAIGRPLIGHASHYRGLMGEPFWQDGVTCIDLDRHPIAEVAEIIRTMTPAKHRAMCEAIRAEFDKIDWDGEAREVAALLGRVPVAA